MRFLAPLPALALAALGSVAMHADTFNFSFGTSSDLISGSGVLTGTLSSPGEYTITAIEGITAYPGHGNLKITGLLAGGSFEGSDNLLSLGGAGYAFDGTGLSYELSDATDVNLYTDPLSGEAEVFQTSDNTIGSQFVPYTVTAVSPEPGSIVLLGTGLLSALGAIRRNART